MGKLKYLNISDTEVKDISPLSELTSLESLDMTAMVVDGIEPLSSLTNLKRFEFNSESAKNGDLSPLHELKNLEKLVIIGLDFDQEEIYALEEAIPGLVIELPSTEGV